MRAEGDGVRWRWRLAWAMFAVAFGSALIFVLSGSPERLDTGDKVASVAGLLVSLMSLVVAVVSLRSAVPGKPVDLREFAEALAQAVTRETEREMGLRGLTDRQPVRVRWRSTTRPVQAAASEVVGDQSGGRAVRLKLHGDVAGIADAWRELPARQMVVLGRPGSGKTSAAMLLVEQVLARREDGQAVPVLLSLSSWNAGDQDLGTWLALRLAEQYPFLRNGIGARLVNDGWILPVLDGLDEVQADQRARAPAWLRQAGGRARPFVLTCRSAEFEEIIAGTGTPLARAAVVELEPVTGSQAAEYLPAGQIRGAERWQPVTGRLRAEPDGPLAEALDTPLMVYLARTAYRAPDSDPARLLEFGSAGEIERHLLGSYVPTLYADGYPPEKAERWLSFLARRSKSTDIAWWRLIGTIPGHRAVLFVTVVVLVVLLVLPSRIFAGDGQLASALILGAFTGGFLIFRQPQPHRFRIRPLVFLGTTAAATLAGIVAVALLLAVLGVVGMVFDDWGPFSPDWPALLGATLILGGGMGLLLGLVLGSAFGTGAPSTAGEQTSPGGTLRQTTTAFLICSLVMFVALTGMGTVWERVVVPDLPQPLVVDLLEVAGAMWTFALLAASLTGSGAAWLMFTVARVLLAVTGRLPWQVMAFVRDAHRRGVLRQVGAEYQFRHDRIARHLRG